MQRGSDPVILWIADVAAVGQQRLVGLVVVAQPRQGVWIAEPVVRVNGYNDVLWLRRHRVDRSYVVEQAALPSFVSDEIPTRLPAKFLHILRLALVITCVIHNA